MFPERKNIDLNGPWTVAWSEQAPNFKTIAELKASGFQSLPCQVPGNFEIDLQQNGLIGDPFFGTNIDKLRQYESTHIWYYRTFDLPSHPDTTPMLVLEGVDCFAELYLNGRRIGSCDNMLIEHSFSLEGARPTGNEMLIHIRPALEEARKFNYPLSTISWSHNTAALYVRKAPHMYGWDIMPRALSAGIWRPARIEYIPQECLESIYLFTHSINRERTKLILRYRAHLKSERVNKYELDITGTCGNSTFNRRFHLQFEAGFYDVDLKDPQLWWPRGRGEQSLYDVEAVLYKNGQPIDRMRFNLGIRTVELKRTSTTDVAGNGEFCFLINGERTFINGTNWVPADVYHSRDAERIPKILESLLDIGCNMVRCWGGNVYEPEAFFDFCDKHGILVWQDFAMACSFYPRDDAFCQMMEKEALTLVRRLRQHPSLALWSGDNECDDVHNWHPYVSPDDNKVTRVIIPHVLKNEDPLRPYLPSSPYMDSEALKKKGSHLPENHLWGPRDYFRGKFYENSLCHFASEIGYMGCPAPESIRHFISADKLWPPGNDEWLIHSTSTIPEAHINDHRIELISNQIRETFGKIPDNLNDYAFQSQCVQAEAKKFFIELFRGAKWRRTGIIWWNLMDGWPQFSDAVIDYYFVKKIAYHFIRRSQRPVLMMLREHNGWNQQLVVCNDTRNLVKLEYTVRDLSTGENVAAGSCEAAADAVTVVQDIPYSRSRQRFLTIEWNGSQGKGHNHYLSGEPPFDPVQYRKWITQAYPGDFASK